MENNHTEIININRQNDVFFKYVFGRDNMKDVLASFLTAVLTRFSHPRIEKNASKRGIHEPPRMVDNIFL